MIKKAKLHWILGFMGFMGFYGIKGLINGDWVEALWVLWFIWFVNFNIEFENISEIDDLFFDLCESLNIKNNYTNIDMEFYNGMSQVVNGKIFIDKRFTDKSGMMKKIIIHELVHYLVFRKYGQLIAFFDEGIAVWYGENDFYIKNYNFNIHEFCKGLLVNDLVYPLNNILDNLRYYGRRHDFRVDFEAASFVSYIILKYGIDRFYSMYIKIKKPDNENPVCNIFEVIRYTYGKDLKILESEWKDFLNNSIEYNPVIDKFIMGRKFYKRIPIKAIHCASCGYPLKNRKEVCVECGFDNSLYK